MRVIVIAPFLELGKGTVVSGLAPDQISRRRLCLKDLGKGKFELTAPTHFKHGETLEFEEVPKSIREFVSVEGERKSVPAGKGLPDDLDGMNRAGLLDIAEQLGMKVPANITKHDLIHELRKADKAKKAA